MLGVLLIQLGTPDAPTSQALRPYLRQFLGDPRVIEVPRWKWWPILQLILLHWTKRQTDLLQQRFPDVPVRFGMQVGNPPVAQVLDDLIRAGVERLLVF